MKSLWKSLKQGKNSVQNMKEWETKASRGQVLDRQEAILRTFTVSKVQWESRICFQDHHDYRIKAELKNDYAPYWPVVFQLLTHPQDPAAWCWGWGCAVSPLAAAVPSVSGSATSKPVTKRLECRGPGSCERAHPCSYSLLLVSMAQKQIFNPAAGADSSFFVHS